MFLGIDVGTQSAKARLYDAQRRQVIDIQSAPLDIISAADGTREPLATVNEDRDLHQALPPLVESGTSGHSFAHELQMRTDAGLLSSIDANCGDPHNGWDTDRFPADLCDAVRGMLVALADGGLCDLAATGGEPAHSSGKQEGFGNIINQYL